MIHQRAPVWLGLLLGGALFSADPPIDEPPQTITGPASEQTARNMEWRLDLQRYQQSIANEQADAIIDQNNKVIFLLQAIAISAGMSLGFFIFSCWLSARRSRLP